MENQELAVIILIICTNPKAKSITTLFGKKKHKTNKLTNKHPKTCRCSLWDSSDNM